MVRPFGGSISLSLGSKDPNARLERIVLLSPGVSSFPEGDTWAELQITVSGNTVDGTCTTIFMEPDEAMGNWPRSHSIVSPSIEVGGGVACINSRTESI
jgi:hypothetical protein